MEKRKIIFDCDPGHDDIMAIMNALAHPEQLEILGYTTVCGNNYVDKITRNLCQVLTALGKDGKVAVGYDAPLVLDPDPQPAAHGESGLDGRLYRSRQYSRSISMQWSFCMRWQ